MKWLGPILLIGVFLRHDTSQWLSGFIPYSPAALFYILGGLWEILLCSVIMVMVKDALVIAALWIGILEGLQISACRLLTADITKVPKGQNLCDHLTSLPIGATMTGLYVIIVCWAIGKAWRK